jgi:hypothetical protein
MGSAQSGTISGIVMPGTRLDKPGHDEELWCKIPGIRVDRNYFQA